MTTLIKLNIIAYLTKRVQPKSHQTKSYIPVQYSDFFLLSSAKYITEKGLTNCDMSNIV